MPQGEADDMGQTRGSGATDADASSTTRRGFLAAGAGALAAGGLVPGVALASRRRVGFTRQAVTLSPSADQLAALRVLGRSSLRMPGSLPHPTLAPGTDTVPQLKHVVVLMMENHSYDNVLGMLGRLPGQRPRGDGFRIAADGFPANSNPQADGQPLRAFRMPTTCQLHGEPSQEWQASHQQYASGRNNGFVVSASGPVAMGYWNGHDLPFTYDLATRFPIGDRWFCSVLGQTDPNRRYLIAGTSSGMTDDIPDASQDVTLGVVPPNGTIFTQLSKHGISWNEYYVQYPSQTSATGNLYPADDFALERTHGKPISKFFSDARGGTLPHFSLIGPNYSTQSQEDPQNMVVGEAFMASIVRAIGHSPKFRETILIIVYDEHGGYYDHVPPPVALAPDAIAPVVNPGESTYDGFKRYGFRVPAIVVSAYAKRHHVSHTVHDHTSILAFVERKWNLPALTLRDANANDLTDFLDLKALAARRPTFPNLPKLAAPGENSRTLACNKSGPGTIPPPRPKSRPHVELRSITASRHRRGVVVRLRTSEGELRGLQVELHHRASVVARRRIHRLTTHVDELVLRVHGHLPRRGHYEITVRQGHQVLARRRLWVP